jgi:hypothetical protein
MPNIGVVYAVYDARGDAIYVGQTRDLRARENAHRRSTDNKPLYRVLDGDCEFVVVEDVRGSQGDLDAAERKWIAELGTMFPAGCNLNSGGAGNRDVVHRYPTKRCAWCGHDFEWFYGCGRKTEYCSSRCECDSEEAAAKRRQRPKSTRSATRAGEKNEPGMRRIGAGRVQT